MTVVGCIVIKLICFRIYAFN